MAKRIKIEQSRAVKLFMDSGVFGAWQRKETLDIKTYIAFLKDYESLLYCYATMDVIPGQPLVPRTMKDVEASAAQGYKNHQQLKDAGLSPIPIFHQGESFKFLEKYLADGEPYIGIATMKDLYGDLSEYHRVWLDQVFSLLTNAKGVPIVKTHGFGITKVHFMLRYPWFSCDSTTWSLAAGFGMIYVPVYRGGKPDYTQLPTRIIMSGRTQISWSSARRQYDALSHIEREHVLNYLEHVGLSLEQVTHISGARRIANVKYFNEFCEAVPNQLFEHRDSAIGGVGLASTIKPPEFEHMNVMHATMVANRGFSRILNTGGAEYRLVSYYDLKPLMKKPDKLFNMLSNYVTHGIDDVNYKPKKPVQLKWNEHYMSHRRMDLHRRIQEQAKDGTPGTN